MNQSKYKTYTEYLATPEFRSVCGIVATRSGNRCEDCGLGAVDFHHVRYCRWGSFDVPENLLHLCRACHENRHRCSRCGSIRLKARHIKSKVNICDQCEQQ